MPLTRREFLAGGLSLSLGLSLSPLAGASALRSAEAFSPAGSQLPPVLVVLTLVGGNDAFNTLVPCGDGAYYDARRSLALPDAALLPVAPGLALNDSLRPLFDRFQRGELALIPGVGWLCEKMAVSILLPVAPTAVPLRFCTARALTSSAIPDG